MSIHDLLRKRLCDRAGLSERRPLVTLRELEQSQWCDEFEQLMRNRLIMGALRYGRLGAAGKPRFDSIASAEKRLKLYRETGNLEHLVDVANLCLVEFVEGTHPLRHFTAADDQHHATT